MYDFDHRLNDRIRKQHYREITEQIQRELFAQRIMAERSDQKTNVAILPLIIAMVKWVVERRDRKWWRLYGAKLPK